MSSVLQLWFYFSYSGSCWFSTECFYLHFWKILSQYLFTYFFQCLSIPPSGISRIFPKLRSQASTWFPHEPHAPPLLFCYVLAWPRLPGPTGQEACGSLFFPICSDKGDPSGTVTFLTWSFHPGGYRALPADGEPPSPLYSPCPLCTCQVAVQTLQSLLILSGSTWLWPSP